MQNCRKGILKGVKVAFCWLKCLNLENKTMNILECHYLYIKKSARKRF